MAKSASGTHRRTKLRPCRVCLKKGGIQPIFGDKTKPDVSLEFYMFSGVQLQENDDFPKCLCGDCYKLLEGAISFRKLAKHSDYLLKRRRVKKEKLFQTQSQPSSSTKIEKSEFDEVPSVKSSEVFSPDFVSVDLDGPTNANTSFSNPEDDTVHDDLDSDDNNDFEDAFNKSVEKPNSSYHCKYCNVTFETSNSYETHRTTVEHKRNYVMSFLPKKTDKSSAQGTKTENSKAYYCNICNDEYPKEEFSKHMLVEHKVKVNTTHVSKKECTECKKMFHPSSLSTHMKKIHGIGSDIKPKVKLECPICHKMFSKHFYPLHVKRHKDGDTRNFICEQCGQKFLYKSSYFTHRLIHSNSLPHKCEYCPYRGRTKELLKTHVRTHTGDYPYKCTQCDMRCSTKSNLTSHMRRHRGPIDFICDACNRGFYTKIQLERHISVSHYGVKNHVCSVCGAAFGYRQGLMSHLRKVHKRPKGLGKPRASYLQLENQ